MPQTEIFNFRPPPDVHEQIGKEFFLVILRTRRRLSKLKLALTRLEVIKKKYDYLKELNPITIEERQKIMRFGSLEFEIIEKIEMLEKEIEILTKYFGKFLQLPPDLKLIEK